MFILFSLSLFFSCNNAQGYDCILVDPASETGVNQAIQRACDAGIKVVVFDQPASVSNDNCCTE